MDRDEIGPICHCGHNCACAGGVHSYADHYAEIIRTYKPGIILEWGPGKNTEIALESGARVFSIEHEEAYARRYSKHDNYQCFIEEVKSDEYISLHNINADLYFVDGRRRSECLRSIFEKATGDYVVCLHDAQRSRYRDAIGLFKNVKFLNGGFAMMENHELAKKCNV